MTVHQNITSSEFGSNPDVHDGASFTGYDFQRRRYRIDLRQDGRVRSKEVDRDQAVKIALQIPAIQAYPFSSLTSEESESLKRIAAAVAAS